jgi:hypothetical protein
MSHFLVLVLLDSSAKHISAEEIIMEVDELMSLHSVDAANLGSQGAHWDAWRIGGRYDGIIGRSNRSSDSIEALVAANSCLMKDYPGDVVPFALVTPDGICYIEGDIGYFGQPSNMDPFWEDTFDRLRLQYGDCTAVVVDAHS